MMSDQDCATDTQQSAQETTPTTTASPVIIRGSHPNDLAVPRQPLPRPTLTILQWNCRGLKRKRNLLAKYLDTLKKKPQIILLQETRGEFGISGYETFSQKSIVQKTRKGNREEKSAPTMCVTLVHKSLAAIQHDSTHCNNDRQEHVTVEVHPGFSDRHVILVNAYWLPGGSHRSPKNWLHGLLQKHRDKDVVIAGDFNSPHVAWGYTSTSKSGRLLEHAMEQHQMTLANDLMLPTRSGNSVQRDANPGGTLTRDKEKSYGAIP